jgi:UDP-N-acetylmuramate--alanine ligase
MRHVHFIGIGGYSMSGLAILMQQMGVEVSGSDMNRSSRTERLQRAGITLYYGHEASQIGDADVVVYTTDVPSDNPERVKAVHDGRLLWHRSELLSYILNQYQTILVGGTAGKTTTSTMIGRILAEAGLDPTVLIGGEVAYFSGNVRRGHGRLAVAEADESDGSFLRYRPWIAVATNVEPEHLEHYAGSFDRLKAAFFQFLNQVPLGGLAVLGQDSAELSAMRDGLIKDGVAVKTYGLDAAADVQARAIVRTVDGTQFVVWADGGVVAEVILPIPGLHNVQNALAAMTACHHAGVSFEESARILGRFENAARRFQRIFDDGRILVVDDYAHHPIKVMAALAAARQVTRGRVVALFQPQRYVRTQNLWEGFVHAFKDADEVYLTEIYSPPGEDPIAGISGLRLADEVRQVHPGPVHFVADMRCLPEMLLRGLGSGDTVITMGAGNVYQVAYALRDALNAAKSG